MSRKKLVPTSDIGKRLKLLRESMNLSQRQMARQLGVSAGYLSDVENGKGRPSFEMILGASLLEGTNIYWLLTGKGPMFLREVQLQDHVNIQDEGLDLVVTNVATGESHHVTSEADLPRVVLPDHQIADIIRDLVEWWRNASDDERAWLRVQLRHTIPGFSKPRRGRPTKQPT